MRNQARRSKPRKKRRPAFRIIPRSSSEASAKISPVPLGNSAQIAFLEKIANSLLTGGHKKRGKPPRMRVGFITGRAYHYHLILTQQKQFIRWGKLASARAEEDLEVVFENVTNYKDSDFRRLFPLMLTVIRERKFPKGSIDAQIRFLANSLAGDAAVSARR